MDRDFQIFFGVLGVGALSALLVWAIVADAFAAPTDYGWIYNYQTLIAGIAALTAALITVLVMRWQVEISRADAAYRTLSTYASALMNVMEKHEAAHAPAENETLEDAQQRLEALRAATSDPTVTAATLDDIFGGDREAVGRFMTFCRFSAVGRVYGKDARFSNLIWPLYVELSEGIIRRRELLRRGARVRELHELTTIDYEKYRDAFLNFRVPTVD